MQYNLQETIIAAFMNKRPVVIVEGYDDIKFYENIAKLHKLKIDVRAIETISGYTEGCEKVIEALSESQSIFQNDSKLKKYAIGIIDRDVRQYLGSVPSIDNILVLKYYSYETHLLTDITLGKAIELLTKASSSMITQNVIEYLKHDFFSQIEVLYYFSLEALKKRIEPEYLAVIEYGEKGGVVTGNSKERRWQLLESKVDSLDQFALLQNITKQDIKYIAKGKWYLAVWCEYLCKKAKELCSLCGSSFPKCSFCESGKPEKCLWKKSRSFNYTELENSLNTSSYIDKEEVRYIAEYMKMYLAEQ